ncbi:unnamed protein product [Mycena citricolor]|uniref:Cytochrome P450 n=1 Tax=Mycena citricolor TaxID=2018698 RepID=A0AAD2Q2W1_9AGAR|nr:unnamed protein product [Mycena citricolor]
MHPSVALRLAMITSILVPIALALISPIVLFFCRILYRNWTSPLHFVDGPACSNIVLGHSNLIVDVPTMTDEWREKFGATFMAKGFFGENELHTKDVKAVAHMVSRGATYQRTTTSLAQVTRLLGEGLLSVEHDPHKRQASVSCARRVLNPAFGVAQVRIMNEVFIEKGNMLRDLLLEEIKKGSGTGIVDLSGWLSQVTLDIIGQAGFGYQFNSMESRGKDEAELSTVVRSLLHSPNANVYQTVQVAQAVLPVLQFVPLPGSQIIRLAQTKLRSIGKQLMHKFKRESVAAAAEKDLGKDRNLLALLIKANMSSDVPASQRLSDEEVISQIPTFFLAGHETTSTALSWAVHALSQHPDIQERLRQELFSLPTDHPTMDELNALPFLENFIRESMRLYAPVVFIQRMASQDDVLPLAKPYVDRQGVSHNTLPIRKGQVFTIPILAINTDKETWGEDALEFKPDRWDHLPEVVHSVPGVWANQMTFFAGSHNCIGFRFSLVEQKAILFTLLRTFEFSPGAKSIMPIISNVLQRPVAFEAGKPGLVSTGKFPVMLKEYTGE